MTTDAIVTPAEPIGMTELEHLWAIFRRNERVERTAERRFGLTPPRGATDPDSKTALEAELLRDGAGQYYQALGELVVGHASYGQEAVTALAAFLAAEEAYTAAVHAYLRVRAFQRVATGPAADHAANIEAARLHLETARGELDLNQRLVVRLTKYNVATVI